MAKTRTGMRRGTRASPPAASHPREHGVGRPLQARMVALEKLLGLFSEEQRLAADSRFNHPMVVRGENPLPELMRQLFAEELAGFERLGQTLSGCHHQEVAGHDVWCLSYFHYDGFRVLVYVERAGQLVAAWRDEEVLQPDSPRALHTSVPEAELEAFFAEVPA